MYKLIRTFLFLIGPEKAHHLSLNLLRLSCKISIIKKIIIRSFKPPADVTTIAGIRFQNKIGLGAGFDKNASYLTEMEALGFGFIEIGTVTPLPQEGNPKPRLFRLVKDKALINRMGFNNDGADAIAERLKCWRKSNPHSQLIIGGNIGKNKLTPNDKAWSDYVICFEKLAPYVDYFVVNVSSPNTPGLRTLQSKEPLRLIISRLHEKRNLMQLRKPIFLKIAPDLSDEEIDDVVSLADEISLDGIVAFNTTLNRSELSTDGRLKAERCGDGGLSGKPLKPISSSRFKYLTAKCNKNIPLIASGGIISPEDAYNRIQNGASLVQVWTGFIYEGPSICKKISRYLAKSK